VDPKDGVDAVAEDVAKALDRAAAYGLRIGYHNHDWELASTVGLGVVGAETISEHYLANMIGFPDL
jgi:hypothetical protein